MRRALAIIFVFVATRAFCSDTISRYDVVPLFVESHWETFSNASSFQESTTNLPPEVRSNILVYLHDINEPWKAENSREPWITNDFLLVWSVTDGTNYVVHWGPILHYSNNLQDELETGGPNYYITAAIWDARKTNFIISTGPCGDLFDPLKDYQAFVDYEWMEAARELDIGLAEGLLSGK